VENVVWVVPCREEQFVIRILAHPPRRERTGSYLPNLNRGQCGFMGDYVCL